MGKGDKKTRRGKLFSGSYGNTRPRKRAGVGVAPSKTLKSHRTAAEKTTQKAVTKKETPAAAGQTATEKTVTSPPKPAAEKEKAAKTNSTADQKKAAVKKPSTDNTTVEKKDVKKAAATEKSAGSEEKKAEKTTARIVHAHVPQPSHKIFSNVLRKLRTHDNDHPPPTKSCSKIP